jgi:hypothetical protein
MCWRFAALVLAVSVGLPSGGSAQSVDEEKRKLEEEKKKLEEDKKKFEEEKKKLEEEKAKERGDKAPTPAAPTPTPAAPTPSQSPPKSGDKLPPVEPGKGPLPDTRDKPPVVDPGTVTPTDKKTPPSDPTAKSTPPGPAAEVRGFSHAGQVFLGLEIISIPVLLGSRVTPPNNSKVGYVPALLVGFGKTWQHMFQLGIGGNFYVDATEFVLGYGMRYYFLNGKFKPYFMWNGGLIFGSGSNFGLHPRAAIGLEYDHTRKFGFWFDTGPGFIVAFKEDVQRFTWSFGAGGNLRF